MRELIIITVASACMALAACSQDNSQVGQDSPTPDGSEPDESMQDGSDADGIAPDADVPEELAPPCDPLAQTGCATGEKCTMVAETANPSVTRTDCVADGDVALSGACTSQQHGTDSWDNCVAGAVCMNGVCDEICGTTPDTCVGGVCTTMSNMFADRTNIGACSPTCDPLTQDCPITGDACYLDVTSGKATCSTVAAQGVQGDVCAYSNSCQVGYGCILPNDPVNPTGLTCAFFCKATGSGGPTCADGPGASYTCVAANTFYSVTNMDPAVGLCVDPSVWTGF